MNMSSTKANSALPHYVNVLSVAIFDRTRSTMTATLSASIQHSYLPRKMGNRQNSDLRALPLTNLGYLGLPQVTTQRPNGLLSTAKESSVRSGTLAPVRSPGQMHCSTASLRRRSVMCLTPLFASKPCAEPCANRTRCLQGLIINECIELLHTPTCSVR